MCVRVICLGEVMAKLDSEPKGKQLSEMGSNMFNLTSELPEVCFLRGTWRRLVFGLPNCVKGWECEFWGYIQY